MIDISAHITAAEACKTSTGLPNEPDAATIKNMQHLAQTVFEPLRNAIGKPILINSFYRSAKVNAAIKGASTSQHVSGQAMDICASDGNNKDLFDYIKKNLPFDQLIWEHGTDANPAWVHVSLKKEKNRYMVMRAKKHNGKTFYEDIK